MFIWVLVTADIYSDTIVARQQDLRQLPLNHDHDHNDHGMLIILCEALT